MEKICLKSNDSIINFDLYTIKKAVSIVRVLDHELRQKIIDLIRQKGHMRVMDICKILGEEQAIISKHLGLLGRVGIVTKENYFFSLIEERVAFFQELITELFQHEKRKISLLEITDLEKTSMVLRALNNEFRLAILEVLNQEERMIPTNIFIKLRSDKSKCSQHQAILRDAGLVITESIGKHIYYWIDYQRLSQVAKFVKILVDEHEKYEKR